jgi:hypothetical protein
MMKLVPYSGHLQPVNNLTIARAIRVNIYRCQIVRLLDARPSIDSNGIKQLLIRRLDSLLRAGKARSATFHD